MNRFRGTVFSAAAALILTLAALLPAVAADGRAPTFWFAGTRLIFDHAIPLEGDVAVASRDTGMLRLLARVGATLAYQPQQRYVVVTTADRRTITFTLGATQYAAGGVRAQAAFAPFVDAGDVVLPLYALARALYLEPVDTGDEIVLQPQIGALDVRGDARRATIDLHAATPLTYVKRTETPERLELAFTGVASTLGGSRRTSDGGTVTIVVTGSAKNPTTIVTIDSPRGMVREMRMAGSANEFAVEVGPGTAPPAPIAALPSAPPPALTPPPFAPTPETAATPPPSLGRRAVVAAISLQPVDGGFAIHAVVNGAATYDWHRLLDGRWYVDVHNATLTDGGRDERPNLPSVESVRVRQIGTPDAPDVRIAITLRGDRRVDLTTTPDGFTIATFDLGPAALARSGAGRVGDLVAQAGPVETPIAVPLPPVSPWKFGAPGNGSKIIVLDPGHGGGDIGTAHNGLVEKTLTLDIARRLRTLLVAQGWQVRLTRDSDVDPVSEENLALMRADGKPNPDDRAYLQTRADVANNVNARMFISIHVNYSPNPGVNGSTFYWYKPEDQALAQAMERAVIPTARTNDMGSRHENLYVTRHANMPAVLIETAFVSNAHDVTLLGSPAFLQSMAQGIANGVKAYVGSVPLQSSQADR